MSRWLCGHHAGHAEPGGSQHGHTNPYNSVPVVGNHVVHQTYILDIHRPESCRDKFTSIDIIHGFQGFSLGISLKKRRQKKQTLKIVEQKISR